jgi:hypothetical protein
MNHQPGLIVKFSVIIERVVEFIFAEELFESAVEHGIEEGGLSRHGDNQIMTQTAMTYKPGRRFPKYPQPGAHYRPSNRFLNDIDDQMAINERLSREASVFTSMPFKLEGPFCFNQFLVNNFLLGLLLFLTQIFIQHSSVTHHLHRIEYIFVFFWLN